MADRILQNAPKHWRQIKGEGSVLGGIGRIIDGNNFKSFWTH